MQSHQQEIIYSFLMSFNKMVQWKVGNNCNTVFSATTGTMFSNSPVSFDTWRTFITGELNGLTLQQQSAATRLSVTTCFHMRHKLYAAVSIIQDQVVLEGNIELDPTYTKINLKGTKPENMPRLSKHRGKCKFWLNGAEFSIKVVQWFWNNGTSFTDERCVFLWHSKISRSFLLS